MGYQEDTPAAVVFHVTHLLKDSENQADEEAFQQWKLKVTCVAQSCLKMFTYIHI